MTSKLAAPFILFLLIGGAAGQGRYQIPDAASSPQYDLSVRIIPDAHRLEASGTVRLPSATAQRNSVQLVMSKIMQDFRVEVLEPAASAGPASLEKKELGQGGRLWAWTIQPAHPFPAGGPVLLRFSYTANSVQAAPRFYLGPEGSFAVGQNFPWYPLADNLYRHTGTLRFHVPAGYAVVATGLDRSVRQEALNGDFRFEVREPSGFSFAAARYVVLRSSNGPVSVAAYLLHPRKSAGKFLDGSSRIINLLTREFGPYPYSKYALVELPTSQAERAGIVADTVEGFTLIRGAIIPDAPTATGISLPFYAHEIAHNWWGNLIKRKGAQEGLMLNEAMANFAALLAVEALEGEDAAARFRRAGYPGYDEDVQSARGYFKLVATGDDVKLDSPPSNNSHRLANSKGFIVHDMLSRLIGRDRFRRLMREFTGRYAFQSVTLNEFMQAVEAGTGGGPDLGWFFEQWLERTGAPDYQLMWKQRGLTAEGTVTQPAPYYRATLEVEILGPGHRLIKKVEVSGERTTFIWRVPFKVDSVVLDPRYKVLRWTPEFRAQANRQP